jgi:O-antigen ligase
LLALYLPREEWTYVQYPGRANVHCDIFQFLAEFGVVGFGLMLVAPLILIVSLFQKTNRRDPLWVMGFIGLSLVVIFSLIDLPFRCPAILCTWLVILAALPKATEVRIQESRNQNPQ